MRTLGQKRAEFAISRVLEITQNMDEKKKKEFRSFSAGTPSMILQNGFGQTLAFWLSKRSDKHLAIFDMIVEWLSYDNGKDIRNTFATKKGRKEFMKELSEMDQSEYLTAQKETLALLEWIKRFANADL